MTDAAIIMPNYLCATEYLQHIVDRIPEDYDVDAVDIVCTRDIEKILLESDLSGFRNIIVDNNKIALGHDLIFRITSFQSSDLKVQFRKVGDPIESIRINIKAEQYDIDVHGRTVPKNKKQWEMLNENDHSIFQRYWPNYEPFRGVIGYFPFFSSWINPAEVGVGPKAKNAMSALCFRHRKGEEDHRKSDKEFIVLLYGGSVAYSIYNSLGQSMGKKLERHIIESVGVVAQDRPIRVVNLALPGFTIADILSVHALHGYRYNPDVVIAHVGFNEIGAIRSADPNLMSSGLFASGKQADLLGSIYGLRTGKQLKRPLQKEFVNNIFPNIELVREKIQYFSKIVKASGAKFILGIQPTIFNKSRLHPLERSFLQSYLYTHKTSDEIAAAYLDGFEWLENEFSKYRSDCDAVVCFNQLIKENEDNRWLFWDHAHMNPAGDGMAAKHYMSAIKRVYANDGR